MIWFKARLYLTSMVAIILLACLFYLLHDDKSQSGQRRSEILLQLQVLDNALDLEILLISSMQQQNYDEIVRLTQQLKQQETDPEIASLFRELPSELAGKLKQYRHTLDQRIQLTERIKTLAAVVRNGLNYMPMLLNRIEESDDAGLPRAEQIVNLLYQYHIFRSDLDAREIRDQLNTLTDNGSDGIADLIFHIQTNLTAQTQLTQLLAEYKQIPNSTAFNQLYSSYLSYRNKVTQQTEYFNSVLIGLTTALILLLTFLYLRLIRSHQQTEQARLRLKDGVDNIKEAFALFDADNRLILSNRNFSSFYPWITSLLKPGTHKEIIQKAIDEKCRYQQESATNRRVVQHIENGNYYLCSNTPTNEGGEVWVRVDITETRLREQELRKLSRALEQSPAAVVITDINGLIEYINPKAEQVSGYSLEEVLGKSPAIFSSGDISPVNYQDMWQQMLAGKAWQGTFLNRRKSGKLYWEAATISAVRDPGGEITHFVAVKEDITERRSTEEQLRMNAAVFETTNEGIIITSPDARIISVNPAFTEITGYRAEEVIGKTPQIFQSGKQSDSFYQEMWQTLENNGSWSGEVWNKRRDGSVYPQWLSIAAVRNSDGQLEQYVAVFSDMTQRKDDEEKIRQQANFDALTSLPNRIMLKRELARIQQLSDQTDSSCALLFIDLDRFKAVNDTLGHSVGDEMLQQVSIRLASVIRDTDLLTRFGGDEFVIVLQSIAEADDASQTAQRVIEVLSPPFQLAGRTLYIGASVGISCYPNDANNGDSMLRNADMAMYLAKEKGRNQYQFFNAEMREHVKNRTEMEQALRLALERNEFELYYQPVCNLETHKVVSVEALIRWHRPGNGLTGPGEFIPLAEETGLIQPIGLWVLQRGCEQLMQWQEQGLDNLCMAVNVSSNQRQLGFDARMAEKIIKRTGADPEKLVFEITESMFLDSSDAAVTWLKEFKALGAKLAIDDFGTGYSSLSYLKQFPVDKLKIDRAFVRDLPDNKEDASLVSAIIAMSQSLDLELIAEGVETLEQLHYLNQLNCTNIQGFLLSKPVTAERLPEVIRQIESSVLSLNPADYEI
ncbi:EAL domain-containing protein [Amphritea pacifica]|uniref:EAL domain-containing protein n=1 Tax=Amphritea pacifica TaxID=2811233 RepID=A0ABS2WDF3_9GAMM|nr:EAL domain-containing protein [Amphritea pacifica]MBN0989616.1 EAL domain-containing protein [Amphritea pacifica]MBN1006557.1 EAL domain-containing protein [Amphritea pacifica]